MVIAAVDVVGDGTADGDEARRRRHGKKKAVRDGAREQVGKDSAGLTANGPTSRIERQDAVMPPACDKGPKFIAANVAIAQAIAHGKKRHGAHRAHAVLVVIG